MNCEYCKYIYEILYKKQLKKSNTVLLLIWNLFYRFDKNIVKEDWVQLTDEQNEILNSSGNVKIHAVAGSGKTSTLIEYARKRGKNCRVLYIAFNRSVKLEAHKRFMQSNLTNVQVETAHSLAWSRIVPQYGYTIRAAYKPFEIAEILNIKQSEKDQVTSIAICNHIGKMVSLFCNQAVSKVQEINYCNYIHESRVKTFVTKHYEKIIDGTRKLLAKMNAAEIPVSHEFYLKKFQLLKPRLDFEMILFDEGQDASPVMLDIFLNQVDPVKIIVGDIHQQIYSWRYATNALKCVDFKDYSLTASFRFSQNIADLATSVLQWKKYINESSEVNIIGHGKQIRKAVSKATLARTNLSLLRSAIDYTNSCKANRKIYFEGNLNSYMYAGEGASLWDVLNLYQGKYNQIRDPLISQMESIEDLQEYADLSNDSELLTLIEMVTEHGRQLPFHISRIKQMHVDDQERTKADMIFSTVHKCKGLEYDSVCIENDFITEKKLIKVSEKKESSQQEIEKLNEEINLLYVAITRSRGILKIPKDIFENRDIPDDLNILPSKRLSKSQKNQPNPPATYQPWTPYEDEKLRYYIQRGDNIKHITSELKKTKASVMSRVKKLGFKPKILK